MTAMVTVAIPVYNGDRYLNEVLSAVRNQVFAQECELLVIDSGSTDNSLNIAEEHGARIHRIAKKDFSHGGTRNLAMELATGDHVAFLTQDATPAHDRWLASLMEGFEQTADVALVFGPHVCRPGASHMIKCEIESHFASWGNGTAINIQQLPNSTTGLVQYRQAPGRWTFFSDVNGAVAKWAWKKIPYRPVPYAEDQLLGREMLEAGFAKVFHPDARVLHSHQFPPLTFFRRYFDEFRSLREVLDHVEQIHPIRTPMTILNLLKRDREWLERNGVTGSSIVKPLLVSTRHHTLRQIAAILGTRADRLPAIARKTLSLDGRDSFQPYQTAQSQLLRLATQPDSKPIPVKENWGWGFITDAFPGRSIRVEAGPRHTTGPLTLAWILPPWLIGSGGHMTIFRLMRELESRGHRNAVFIFDPFRRNGKPAVFLKRQLAKHFLSLEAEVFLGLDDFDSADVAIATEWSTAFPVRDLPNCKEKVYFIQDHEPEFYPTSAQHIWAQETYRMGYRCVTCTQPLAKLIEERYGAETAWFDCGTDLQVFSYADLSNRQPEVIALYARRETDRRAVDLAIAGLELLSRRRPTIRPVLFGSRKKVGLPFVAENLGVVPPTRLAELYRHASVGMVFSLTNQSLVAQEMMASGLPTVELDGPNALDAWGESGDVLELAARRPDAIADAVEKLLDDREHATAMTQRARKFAEERTWERAGRQVETALLNYLETPRAEQAVYDKS